MGKTRRNTANEHVVVTPLQAGMAGGGILMGGALVAGLAHYAGTAKSLAEEGVSPAARVRAMPVALQALGFSTFLCCSVGAAALICWNVFGMDSKRLADLGSMSDAISLAKQQRVSLI